VRNGVGEARNADSTALSPDGCSEDVFVVGEKETV
jgi:hypothetical protein